jgi:hypothetical protein
MSNVLSRIRAKIDRAKQHIQDFQLGLTAFYKSDPYLVGAKENKDTGKRIYYVIKADSVPDPLTAIAADVIQNLRSPLDQVAYQLVLAANGGAHPSDKGVVYYPITSAPSEAEALCRRNMQGVRQEVIQAINATEPYKGGKGHALWQLNELNKPDKHQLLVGAATMSGGVDIMPTLRTTVLQSTGVPQIAAVFDQIGPLYLRETALGPANLGDELYVEPIEHEVQKDRRFAFHVTLNAPGIVEPEPAIKTLQDMANLVNGIVTALGKFLS